MAEFHWARKPSQAWDIKRYVDSLEIAVTLALMEWQPAVESYAKQNARWKDRTGNARQTLAAFVYSPEKRLVSLVLKQHMTYGKYLELKNAGRYAIVLRTLEQYYTSVWRSVNRVIRE